jgi:threonine dehydratase
VTAEAIGAAQAWLWRHLRLIAEPGGATALAAIASGLYTPAPQERVGVVICGANTDPATIASMSPSAQPGRPTLPSAEVRD